MEYNNTDNPNQRKKLHEPYSTDNNAEEPSYSSDSDSPGFVIDRQIIWDD